MLQGDTIDEGAVQVTDERDNREKEGQKLKRQRRERRRESRGLTRPSHIQEITLGVDNRGDCRHSRKEEGFPRSVSRMKGER